MPHASSKSPIHHAPARPFDRVVIPVQGSDREFLAQITAIQMAAEARIPILAIHVGEAADAGLSEREGRERFAWIAKECAQWSVPFELRLVTGGDVVHELLEELDARDLVVIGTARLGSQWHVGSVTAELIRRAPCPIQVVRLE